MYKWITAAHLQHSIANQWFLELKYITQKNGYYFLLANFLYLNSSVMSDIIFSKLWEWWKIKSTNLCVSDSKLLRGERQERRETEKKTSQLKVFTQI